MALQYLSWPDGIGPLTGAMYPARVVAISDTATGLTTPRRTRRPGVLWKASFQFELSADKAGLMHGLLDRLEEDLSGVLVPSFDRARPSVAMTGVGYPSTPPQPFSDTRLRFADTQGGFFVTRQLMVGVDAPAGVGVITLGGFDANVAALGPGDRFSIDGRLYQVRALAAPLSDAAGEALIPITPPLREPIEAGDKVMIAPPVCRMILTSAEPNAGAVRKPGRTAFHLNFIEADIA